MQQSIRAVNSPLKAAIIIPGSKSVTIRALLMTALAKGTSHLFNLSICKETKTFLNNLRELGIAIEWNESDRTCMVTGGIISSMQNEISLDYGQSVTVLLFLIAICTLSSGTFHFHGSSQCNLRTLIQVLHSQNIKITSEQKSSFTMINQTGLLGGEIQLKHFISALFIVAPFAKQPFTFDIKDFEGNPYADTTLAVMAEFGVLVRRLHQGRFIVPVPQRYLARDYIIEPDLSIAAYFLAAAAVTRGEITMQAFHREFVKQPDVKMLALFEKMGCVITENDREMTMNGSKELQGVNIDARGYSHAFMAIAAIAPFAQTPTTITNIRRKKYLKMMCTEFKKLQIRVESGQDWIKIFPSKPKATLVNCHHNRYLAMAFAVIGLVTPGLVIDNVECVDPEFFNMWEAIS